MLPRELRNHIMTPALVPGWQQLTRRSPRPGEATDFAAAGVPSESLDLAGYQREVLALH